MKEVHKAEDHAAIASRLFQGDVCSISGSLRSNDTAERSAEHPAGAAYGSHSGSSLKARLPAAK